MDITIFKKLGLSDKEIKIYLTILKYGAISVRNLAELAGLNRGTTYGVLKNLQQKGLISYYHQETKQKFVAEEPEKLLKLLKDRENELKRTKDKLKKIIPQLKSAQYKGGSKPTTKFYEGKKGVKIILEDILISVSASHNKEYYIYSATEASDDLNSAYPDFTKNRIKKGICVKAISLAKGGGISGLDERRWIGANDKSATFINIYADKCAFISRDSRNNPVGVIIENAMIYETQKIIFLQLWKLLKGVRSPETRKASSGSRLIHRDKK
ncbi:MAG: helix-turn-helix domain-containing protein [Patescibacteria group bacterium]|nr:helix-turn-helix domain-containing protein [Patescibacteria group bacterium]